MYLGLSIEGEVYVINTEGRTHIIYSGKYSVFLEEYILFNNSIIVHRICPKLGRSNHFVIIY